MPNNYSSITEAQSNKNKEISINSCHPWSLLLSFSKKAVMIQFSAGFVDLRLALNLIKGNPAYCLILITSLVNFPPIPQIRSTGQIRGIGGNFSKLKDFLFSFFEIVKVRLKYIKWLVLSVRCNITRISQFLSTLASRYLCRFF